MPNAYEVSNAFIEANGVRFHYALEGDPALPVLALVNMGSHNLTCWEIVLADLTRDFRVLRFDIRGTGKSGWGAAEDFTFSQYADDLAAIMDALDIDKACVVGVAYGARTAAQFALNHAGRLSALGLFDVALTPPVEQTGQHELARQARELLRGIGEPEVELQKYWRFYEDRDAAFNAHTAHLQEPDMTAALDGLKIPVLVACGEQDMNLQQARRVAASIPGSQFELMPMTGHASPFFRPGLFATLITDFYRSAVVE